MGICRKIVLSEKLMNFIPKCKFFIYLYHFFVFLRAYNNIIILENAHDVSWRCVGYAGVVFFKSILDIHLMCERCDTFSTTHNGHKPHLNYWHSTLDIYLRQYKWITEILPVTTQKRVTNMWKFGHILHQSHQPRHSNCSPHSSSAVNLNSTYYIRYTSKVWNVWHNLHQILPSSRWFRCNMGVRFVQF